MKTIKNNRLLSFFTILIIYIIATIIGLFIYQYLPYSIYLNIFIADTIATIIIFCFSILFRNASIYDPYWSVQPAVILIALFVTENSFTSENNLTRILVLLAILIWSIRLTGNWAYTFANLEHEDWRYRMLKEKSGKLYPFVNFFGIHYFPTVVVYFCILPVIYLFTSNIENPTIFIYIFLILAFLAVTIQGISDYEMHRFRKKKTHTLIREGLWKYSRHPNYLGEIMMWWSVALYCIFALKDNYVLILGAVLNTMLFLFISIPLAEKHQAERKEGFDQYLKETRMLLPIKK